MLRYSRCVIHKLINGHRWQDEEYHITYGHDGMPDNEIQCLGMRMRMLANAGIDYDMTWTDSMTPIYQR